MLQTNVYSCIQNLEIELANQAELRLIWFPLNCLREHN